MFQFFEAAGIALDAIWSNKLRSFLTVLGNIVAVTSIIAVVSLVQGMNEYVDVGDRLRRRRRQLHHPADAGHPHRGGRRARAEQPAAHARRGGGGPEVRRQRRRRGGPGERERARHLRRHVARQHPDPGRLARLHLLLHLHGRTGPPDQSGGDRHEPARHGARLGYGRPPLRSGRSARQGHQDRRPPLPRRRRQREEGVGLRPVAGRIRHHPHRRVPEDVRLEDVGAAARRQAEVARSASRPPWTTRPSRCGSSAA